MLLLTCADVRGQSQAQALMGVRHSHLSLTQLLCKSHPQEGQAGCSGADRVACNRHASNSRLTSADIVSWPHLKEKWLPLSPLPATTEEVTGVVVDPAGPTQHSRMLNPKQADTKGCLMYLMAVQGRDQDQSVAQTGCLQAPEGFAGAQAAPQGLQLLWAVL